MVGQKTKDKPSDNQDVTEIKPNQNHPETKTEPKEKDKEKVKDNVKDKKNIYVCV